MFHEIFRRGAGRLVLIVIAAGAAQTAAAADKELLDILLANGAISQAQYEQLLVKESLTKADVNSVVATLDSKGFNAKSADGNYAIKVGTRLHFEASTHSGSLPGSIRPVNGTELRRARLETKGKFARVWDWAADIDFADNKTTVKDFWVGYNTSGGTHVTFGNQKQPYNLSFEMSSNDLPFIERPVDNFLLAPVADRALGLRVEKSGSNWFAAGGIFGGSVSPEVISGDEGWGLAARLVYSPVVEEDRVVHLGLHALSRRPATSDPSLRIRDETTHLSGLRIVDTGEIAAVGDINLAGVEAAFALGAFSVVGEYNKQSIARDNRSTLDFDGWSLYATWSLTGESRASTYSMKSGEFKQLRPAAGFDLDKGTWGAWELALRYANIDLNDGAFTGGEESVMTSALNWYLNRNLRLMLEWSRIVDTDGSSVLRDAADGLDIYQFRTQYSF